MKLDLSGTLKRTAIICGQVMVIGGAVTAAYEFAPWVRADSFAQHQDRFRMVAEETLPRAISDKLSEIIMFRRLIDEAADAGQPEQVRKFRLKIQELEEDIDGIRELREQVRSKDQG